MINIGTVFIQTFPPTAVLYLLKLSNLLLKIIKTHLVSVCSFSGRKNVFSFLNGSYERRQTSLSYRIKTVTFHKLCAHYSSAGAQLRIPHVFNVELFQEELCVERN